MIDRVVVVNWQSLRRLDLELGRFTVIVGRSSSGKTALMRAFKAVASNVRGAGHITRGATTAAITVHTNGAIVTLERNAHSGLYRVVDTDGREQTYTKLASTVPSDVTQTLGIQPVPTNGTSISFAGQFDRPYLLDPDDSGAKVARVLGELTNVTTIFEAVREANRRRTSHATTLRTREADLAEIRTQFNRFSALPSQLAACTTAEQAVEQAAQLCSRATRLRGAIQTLHITDSVLASSAELPEVPTETAVVEAQHRLSRARRLLSTLAKAINDIRVTTTEVIYQTGAETDLRRQLHDTLIQAGTCPTCGQTVDG